MAIQGYVTGLPYVSKSMGPLAAAAVPAGINAAAGLAGAALGNKGAKEAAKTQEKANREAMAYQREQDAKEEARYREQEAKLEAQWNAEQARLAPYRQAAESLLGQNAKRLGISFTPSAQPAQMPAGWSGTVKSQPKTLSSLAGSGYIPPEYAPPPLQAPMLSLSDILNNRWSDDRRVS